MLYGAELAVAGGGGQEFFGRHLGRSEIEAVFQILPHDGGQTHVIRLKLLLFNQTPGVQSAEGFQGDLGSGWSHGWSHGWSKTPEVEKQSTAEPGQYQPGDGHQPVRPPIEGQDFRGLDIAQLRVLAGLGQQADDRNRNIVAVDPLPLSGLMSIADRRTGQQVLAGLKRRQPKPAPRHHLAVFSPGRQLAKIEDRKVAHLFAQQRDLDLNAGRRRHADGVADGIANRHLGPVNADADGRRLGLIGDGRAAHGSVPADEQAAHDREETCQHSRQARTIRFVFPAGPQTPTCPGARLHRLPLFSRRRKKRSSAST